MDVDQGRLDMVYELARRYAAEMGADLRFAKTLDREAALREADFVLNTAMVGGHDQQESDRELMEQHGYYRGVRLADEYRQFDLMLNVAHDIERLCPEAWLIQSSNPVFEGCTLMSRETDVKLIGLCHGHYGYKEIVEVLGLDPAQVTYEIPGFNHCIWMTHFRYQGQDAYPLIDEWIENESERYWRDWNPQFHQTQMSPAAVQHVPSLWPMPIGDTSRALWEDAWWYHLNDEAKRRWWGPLGGFDSAAGWAIYLEGLNRRIAQIREVASDPKRKVSEVFPPVQSGEQIVPIIDSLVNDKPGSYQVNVPNDGALRAIPDNVVVEVPAIIDGKGVRPLAVGWLPETVMRGSCGRVGCKWNAPWRRISPAIRLSHATVAGRSSHQDTRTGRGGARSVAAQPRQPAHGASLPTVRLSISGNTQYAEYLRRSAWPRSRFRARAAWARPCSAVCWPISWPRMGECLCH
jgi:alpha-galactosidase